LCRLVWARAEVGVVWVGAGLELVCATRAGLGLVCARAGLGLAWATAWAWFVEAGLRRGQWKL